MKTRRKLGTRICSIALAACILLGLLPMAFGMGEGSEIMMPMATVMITGLVVSTVVTLLFTPVYYSLLDGLDTRLRKHTRNNKEVDGCQG